MDSLAAKAARGVLTTLLGQWLRFGVQLASLMVLARLLEPADFGRYAIVMAFAGFGIILGDMGLSLAAVQAKEVSASEQTNLFWANVALGLGLAAIVAVFAGPIAAAYRDPEIANMLRAVGGVFVINGVAAQYRASATRDMSFSRLAGADVFGQACGLAIAVVAAGRGWGAWALVLQLLIASLSSFCVVIFHSSFHPGWPCRGASLRRFTRFGAGSMGVQLVNYFGANVDSMVLGRVVGPAPLGVYDRAYQLFKVPMQQVAAPLTRVALPVLSRLVEDRPRYMAFLGRAQLVSAYVLVAAFAFAGGASEPLLAVVLGPGWGESAVIFRILVVGGAFQGLGYVFYWIFLSQGRPDVHLAYSILGRAIAVTLIVTGSVFFGIRGAALGTSVGYVVIWIVYNQLALPKVDISRTFLPRGIWRPLFFGAAVFIGGYVTTSMPVAEGGPILGVVLALCGSVVGGLLIWVCIPALRRDVREVVATAVYARNRK